MSARGVLSLFEITVITVVEAGTVGYVVRQYWCAVTQTLYPAIAAALYVLDRL